MQNMLATEVETERFALRPLHPRFGAELIGVDLAQTIDDALFASIYQAFLRYQVLLFRPGELAPGQQVSLARRFGEVQIHVMDQYHADGYPELYLLSNLDAQGQPGGKHPDKGTLVWHTDGSWRERTGQATIMYAVEVPEKGGETHFCDMYGAYELLSDDWTMRLKGLKAIHNLDFSRRRRHAEDPLSAQQKQAIPPVEHPIIRTHPETGRLCIFLGDHAETIATMDYAAGRELVEQINAMITPPELVYRHHWQPGELIVWDNRCLLHRATAYDASHDRRVIRRCTVLGDAPH